MSFWVVVGYCPSADADSISPWSENSRRLWLSEIDCWKGFPGKNSDAAGKWFPDFPAARNAIPAKVWALSETAAGKLAAPAGTLLDFLLWDRRSLLVTWPQLGPFFVPACPPLTAINGHWRLLTAPFLCLNSTLRSLRTLEMVWRNLAPKPVNARISGQRKAPIGAA